MKPRKVPHVAFITREAFHWKEFDVDEPGLRQFVRIPTDYGHSGFRIQWVRSGGTDFAAIWFTVHRRRKRPPKNTC